MNILKEAVNSKLDMAKERNQTLKDRSEENIQTWT